MSVLSTTRPLSAFTRLFGVLLALLLAPHDPLAAVRVEFLIDLRAEIAAGRFMAGRDEIGVRGQTPPLSWERSLLASPTGTAGVYSVAVSFDSTPPDGQRLEYKLKIEGPGKVNDGWEGGRNRGIVARSESRRIERAFNAWEPDRADGLPLRRTGRIDRIASPPSKFVAQREVQVWLPPGYDKAPARRYPVLYMLDGQTVFDVQYLGAELGLDETAQRLVEAGAIEPMIVVAVDSSDSREELLPAATDGDGKAIGGGAAPYANYLIKELKPLIDRQYRTRRGRADTAVGGISLGGLMTMWLLLEHPETYGAGLAISPSAWWGGESIVKHAERRARRGVGAPRIWLDVGTKEPQDMIGVVPRLRDALVSRGWAPNYLEAIDAGHEFSSWASRVEPMLRFLYGAPGARR